MLAAGCSGNESKPAAAAATKPATCPQNWKAGWQRLANRIHADGLLPDLDAEPARREDRRPVGQRRVGGEGPELPRQLPLARAAEPGRPRQLPGLPRPDEDPALRGHRSRRRKGARTTMPCFSDPHGKRRLGGITATMYTVNRGVDQWHILYAWHDHGSLYARQRARDQAAHLPQGREQPRPHGRAGSSASSRQPDAMKLTRKELLLGGAAGAALGAAGIYELVDKLADSPPGALRRGPRARAAPGRRHARREAGRRRGRRAASASRGGHGSRRRAAGPAPRRARRAFSRPDEARCRLSRRRPTGSRRHVALGPAVLPDACCGRRGRAPAVRPPGEEARADRRDPLPERPSRDAARGNDVAFLLRSDNEEHIRAAATGSPTA